VSTVGLLEDTNILKGAFGRDPQQLSPDERDRSARRWGIAGIVLGVIWFFGMASIFAIGAGLLARMQAQSEPNRRLANVAILLGIGGLVLTALLVVVGGVGI